MKKINRADLLGALFRQFQAQDLSPEPFSLSESIQPVVDISRPSKIPYADWYAKGNSVTDAAFVPAKVGKRFVLVHCAISTAKAVTDTGSQYLIRGIVNGVLINIAMIMGVTGTVDYQTVVVNTELIFDENTAIDLNITGTYSTHGASIAGYYVVA